MAQVAASGNPAEARGFEALGDANRREILRILSDGSKPVREIANAMTISRPAVSRHLRLLKGAGMVAEQADGARRIYHLQERGIEAVREYLEQVWGEAVARFQLLATNTGPSRSGGGNAAAARPLGHDRGEDPVRREGLRTDPHRNRVSRLGASEPYSLRGARPAPGRMADPSPAIPRGERRH